jgi:hypothetical protein
MITTINRLYMTVSTLNASDMAHGKTKESQCQVHISYWYSVIDVSSTVAQLILHVVRSPTERQHSKDVEWAPRAHGQYGSREPEKAQLQTNKRKRICFRLVF